MIYFNVDRAKNQLINSMKVYTLRSARRATGVTMAVVGGRYNHREIYPVNVERITTISKPEDLLPYLDYSGFDSVLEWLLAASLEARTLYKVTKYEGG